MQRRIESEFDEAIRFLRGRLQLDLLGKLNRGDLADSLLEHLRSRRRPRLLFSPENLQRIAARTARHDPDQHDWAKEIADNAVAGRIYAASNERCRRFVEVDPATFDFSSFEHFDPQSIHGLGRHRWLACLAQEYWSGRERKYFDALMEHWDFYARKVPFPGEDFYRGIHAIGPSNLVPPFGELDCFIRLTNWWWAYWLALHAGEMTPQRNAVLLARCLKLFDLVAARGVRRHEHNFTAMQMESLYLWAASLPEVTGMDVWKHNSRNTMESSLARAVFDDGVQWEKSAGYHAGCIRWYGTGYLLGKINAQDWASAYGERLRKMGEFLDAIATPGGETPLMSDADRSASAVRGSLSLSRCIFPDMKFRRPVAPSYFSLWASDATEWDPADTVAEKESVSIFPDGGVAAVRHRDTSLGCMLILDNGPTHAGHSHMDNMTVHFEAIGGAAIVDPGRWIYANDAARSWVTHCQSHNTVYIEDRPLGPADRIEEEPMQVTSSTGDPRIGRIQSIRRDGMVMLTTSFRAYAAEPEAVVRRTAVLPIEGPAVWLAVIDEIEAPAEHTWTNSWLLPAAGAVEPVGQGYRLRLDSGVWLAFCAAADAPLTMRDDLMFWCPQYAEKAPARWVRFSARCTRARRGFLFRAASSSVEPPAIELTKAAARLTIGDVHVEIDADRSS